tara:strand:+ start:147 stop:311 length:165 start_codon:yes stop_codon:yes gene_type:complete
MSENTSFVAPFKVVTSTNGRPAIVDALKNEVASFGKSNEPLAHKCCKSFNERYK